ncbi:MAG TPA: hypothetical protein VGZ47_20005, partial [Gemmataceae bacterium]|nr:hypothetical protein [Gemmataceae bacterium]
MKTLIWLLALAMVGLIFAAAAGLIIAADFIHQRFGIGEASAFGLLLVTLVMLNFAMGAVLPKRVRMHGDMQFGEPPAAVWRRLMHGSATCISSDSGAVVERLPDEDEHPVWRVTLKNGDTLVYEAVEAIAPRRLVVRIRARSGISVVSEEGSISGDSAWDLEEYERGTRVRFTSSAEVPSTMARPIAYLFMLFFWPFHVRGR